MEAEGDTARAGKHGQSVTQAALEQILAVPAQHIPLAQVRTHAAFQPRIEQLISAREVGCNYRIRAGHVDSLLLKLKGSNPYDLEPILLGLINDSAALAGPGLYVLDGHHRLAAYRRAQRHEIPARVLDVNYIAALLISKIANCSHRSLKMHEEERREAAWQTLAISTEGGKKALPKDLSTRKIAGLFDISKNTAQRMIKRLGEVKLEDYPDGVLAPETRWPRWQAIRESRSTWEAHLSRLSPEARSDLEARCLIGKICDLVNKASPATRYRATELLNFDDFYIEYRQQHAIDDLLDLIADDRVG